MSEPLGTRRTGESAGGAAAPPVRKGVARSSTVKDGCDVASASISVPIEARR